MTKSQYTLPPPPSPVRRDSYGNGSLLPIYLVIGFLLIVAIGVFSWRNHNVHDEQLEALRSETKLYRNKNNELVSENRAFVGDKKQLQAELDYWKKKGDTLTSKFTNATRQLTLLKKEFEINGRGVPKVHHDTMPIIVGSTKIDTPRISVDTADQYHTFRFASSFKEYAYEVRVFDKTELVIREEKSGTLVSAINSNPYVISSETKSVLVRKKKPSPFNKLFWLGVGAAAGILLLK